MQKVINLESPRTGNPVANQFVIKEKGEGWNGNFISRETFQSYDSVIAIVTKWNDRTDVVLDATYWDYSNTTRRYLYLFLRSCGVMVWNKKQVLEAIEKEEVKTGDLNK